VCEVNSNDELIEVIERTKIANVNGKVEYNVGEEGGAELNPQASVSMNYWGFHPSIFEHIENGLHAFMKAHSLDPKAEYYIPNIVTDLINNGTMAVRVIPTTDTWFGVTYKEDKPMAVAAIAEQIEKGVYPTPLWG
jgi:hypothetical protein